MAWRIATLLNIIPTHDSKEHVLSAECWCSPKLKTGENIPIPGAMEMDVVRMEGEESRLLAIHNDELGRLNLEVG